MLEALERGAGAVAERGEAGAEPPVPQVPQSRRSRRHLARVLSPCARPAPPSTASRESGPGARPAERSARPFCATSGPGAVRGSPRGRAWRAPERPARGPGRARAAPRGRARRAGGGALRAAGTRVPSAPVRPRPLPLPIPDSRGGARQDTPPLRPRPRRRLRSGLGHGHGPRRCCRRAPPQRRELRP